MFVGETQQGVVEDGRGIRYKAEVAKGLHLSNIVPDFREMKGDGSCRRSGVDRQQIRS